MGQGRRHQWHTKAGHAEKCPLCGEGEMWPITRPGAAQKPDAITVCNKGEGCAKMTTVPNMAKTSVTWMRKLLDLTSRRCSKPCGCLDWPLWSFSPHVQGVRLNRAIFTRERGQLGHASVLRYDAVGNRRRQEGHHGHDNTADSSRSTLAFGPGSLTAPGGGHRD